MNRRRKRYTQAGLHACVYSDFIRARIYKYEEKRRKSGIMRKTFFIISKSFLLIFIIHLYKMKWINIHKNHFNPFALVFRRVWDSAFTDSIKVKAEFLQKVSLRLAKYRLCNVYCIISMPGRFSFRKNFGHTIMSALFNVPKVVFCARPCVWKI